MQILLTRPLDDSRAFAELLEAEGVDVLIWPLTRIVPTVTSLKLPTTTGGLLFTSANGVRALAALTGRRDLPALCVGNATAAVARNAGFMNCFSAHGDAGALADLARRSGIRAFFHARGRETAGDLKEDLAATGQIVTEAILYKAEETGPPPAAIGDGLIRGSIDLVTIWSRRNAGILARHLTELSPRLDGTSLLAISPGAAEPLAAAGFRSILIAKNPDAGAMLEEIRGYSSGVWQ